MTRAAPFIISWLLFTHIAGLFFILPNPAKKQEARAFLTAAFAAADEIPWSRRDSSIPAVSTKPRIPFRILNPFANDSFTFEAGRVLPLSANKPAHWFVDNIFFGEGREVFWPLSPGRHFIQAVYDSEEARMVMIEVK